jgi:Mrp family chromosome partitioning ATPase
MSRNFELLQRAQREHHLFAPQPAPAVKHVSTGTARAHEGITVPADGFCPSFGSAVAPEMIQLVQRVFLASGTAVDRTVVFAGVDVPDTGSVAIRACEALCLQTQGTVCLVDAKLGSPSAHAAFGLENAAGVTTALSQGSDLLSFAHGIPGFRFMVVPAGPPIERWQAALGSELMRGLLEGISSECDYVVVDAPVASTCPATASLGRAADGLVLVIDADSTRRELARTVVRDLEHSGVRLIGTILNNRRFPIPDYLYSKL